MSAHSHSARSGGSPRNSSRSGSAPRSGASSHFGNSPRSGGAGRSRQRTSGSRPSSTSTRPRSIWDELPVQVVPTENLPSFAELGLPTQLVTSLARAGLSTPFPIQAATIPDVISGRDLLGRAATGAGKTLAFGLPMIARLAGSTSQPRRPRALILVPTRELAMQVSDSIAPLAAPLGVSVRLVAGGLPIGKQISALERGVDVLVATPGRLVDLLERKSCSLSDVQITVLDEADHMADLGFLPVVRQLLDLTPSDGQRLLFSATLDGDVATLVDRYLTEPAVHALSSAEASVDTMSHHLFRVDRDAKFDVIAEIAGRPERSILFVRTKHGAERLARNLGRIGVAAGALHGGRTQSQRNRALDAFKDGSVPVLVATDVAARGIHVDDVSLVLHVDPPQDGKDYLHRSGRTARAGNSGVVVLLTQPDEERAVRKMLSEAGVRPDQRDVAPGDITMAQITSARPPSGVPVVVAAPRDRSGRSDGGRPRNGASRSPRDGASRSAREGGPRPARNGSAPRDGAGRRRAVDAPIGGASRRGPRRTGSGSSSH
jgi:superfamily II DNA/RNA helicase